MRALAKNLLPPVATDILRRYWPKPLKQSLDAAGFTGNFHSWQEAQSQSSGYDAPLILAKTRAAILRIKAGEDVYERDSVILPQPEYPFPVIASLLHAALAGGGKLSILDFGGALGSSYFQCRRFLQPVPEVRWSVVEQPAHVECGKLEFETEELKFYGTVDECVKAERPQLLLLSSVLQYLPDPYAFIASIRNHLFRYVLVDRTTVFSGQTPDRLTVQKVPESIYPASYPCWMLNYHKLRDFLAPDYSLVAEFPAHVGTTIPFEGIEATYAGFLLERKKNGGCQNHVQHL